MNRRKLERHLAQHGCYFLKHGGGHDAWTKIGLRGSVTLPRHTEVKHSIVKSICKDLGVPLPSEK